MMMCPVSFGGKRNPIASIKTKMSKEKNEKGGLRMYLLHLPRIELVIFDVFHMKMKKKTGEKLVEKY